MNNLFLQVVAYPNFVKLWLSQILSQLSLNILNFVLILRIFEETGSTVAVSLVWFFYAIPAILLGPFSGTIVDLVSRRRLLILTNFAQAVIVLLYLPITRSIWPIYSVIFLYSLLNQLFIPAEAATLPSVIQRKLLPVANSLFLFTIYGAFIVGFGLAGPIIQLVGRRTPFVLASLMLALAAIFVSLLPEEIRKPKLIRLNLFFLRLLEGYRFLRTNPLVLFPVLLLVSSNIIVAILAVSAPALTVNVLGIPLVEASTRLMVPAGIGAVSGAFLVARLLRDVRKKYVIGGGLILSALSFALFSFVIPQISFAKASWGSLAAFFLGIAFVSTVIPLQTLIQEKTPFELRGRVFGVLSFLITLASLVPVLFAATLAELLGELTLLAILAVFLFGLGIVAINSEEFFRRY